MKINLLDSCLISENTTLCIAKYRIFKWIRKLDKNLSYTAFKKTLEQVRDRGASLHNQDKLWIREPRYLVIMTHLV